MPGDSYSPMHHDDVRTRMALGGLSRHLDGKGELLWVQPQPNHPQRVIYSPDGGKTLYNKASLGSDQQPVALGAGAGLWLMLSHGQTMSSSAGNGTQAVGGISWSDDNGATWTNGTYYQAGVSAPLSQQDLLVQTTDSWRLDPWVTATGEGSRFYDLNGTFVFALGIFTPYQWAASRDGRNWYCITQAGFLMLAAR